MTTSAEAPVASVLLVDDRPENLLALEAVLKPLKVRLVKARSGEEALVHLLRETFAVILLDVQMPRLDGLQTAELIKQREQTRHVPIIFITALSREAAYVFKGYAQGAVDYLLKPIDGEILRAKVRVFCDLWVRGEKLRAQAAESEMKDVFLASVAHEMRTPLAAAKAQAQLALHQLAAADCDTGSAGALQLISRQIDKVVRLVKTLGMVNCTADFKDQPAVINGFSDLMVEVFGAKAGKGARSAVGMASLPGGIPVEVEAIFQVRG